MKPQPPNYRNQICAYDAYLISEPELDIAKRFEIMKEILRLAHLLKLSEENTPIPVSYMQRESQMNYEREALYLINVVYEEINIHSGSRQRFAYS